MEIDMDKYTIKSDTQNLWIEKKYMTSDGKIYTKRVAGYRPGSLEYSLAMEIDVPDDFKLTWFNDGRKVDE